MTPELRDELVAIAANPTETHAAYRLRYKNFFMGQWIRHCGIYPAWILRFFRPENVRWERGGVLFVGLDLPGNQKPWRRDPAEQADYDRLSAGFRAEEKGQAKAHLDQARARQQKLETGPRKQEIAAAQADLRFAKSQLPKLR